MYEVVVPALVDEFRDTLWLSEDGVDGVEGIAGLGGQEELEGLHVHGGACTEESRVIDIVRLIRSNHVLNIKQTRSSTQHTIIS